MDIRRYRLLVVAGGVVAIGGLMLGLAQDEGRSSSLRKSVGLECKVYFAAAHTQDAQSLKVDGLHTRGELPVSLSGTLTAVSEDSFTVRTKNKVFWVRTDAVAIVEFEKE
jgi:hypothetical protein